MSECQLGQRSKRQTITATMSCGRRTETDAPTKLTTRLITSSKMSPEKEMMQHNHCSSTDSGRSSISGSHCGEVGDGIAKETSSPTSNLPVSSAENSPPVKDSLTTHTTNTVQVDPSTELFSNRENQLTYLSQPEDALNDYDIYSDVTLIPKSSETLTVLYKSGRPCAKRIPRNKVDKSPRKQKHNVQQSTANELIPVRQGTEVVVALNARSNIDPSATTSNNKRETEPTCGQKITPAVKIEHLDNKRHNCHSGVITEASNVTDCSENGERYMQTAEQDEDLPDCSEHAINSEPNQIPDPNLASTDRTAPNKRSQSGEINSHQVEEVAVIPLPSTACHQPNEVRLYSTDGHVSNVKDNGVSTCKIDTDFNSSSNVESSNSSLYSNRTDSSNNSGTEHSSPEHQTIRDTTLRPVGLISPLRKPVSHQQTNDIARRRPRPGCSPVFPTDGSYPTRSTQRNLPPHIHSLPIIRQYGASQPNSLGLLPMRRGWTERQKKVSNSIFSVHRQQTGNQIALVPPSLVAQSNSCVYLQPIDPVTLVVNPAYNWWLSPGQSNNAMGRIRFPANQPDASTQLDGQHALLHNLDMALPEKGPNVRESDKEVSVTEVITSSHEDKQIVTSPSPKADSQEDAAAEFNSNDVSAVVTEARITVKDSRIDDHSLASRGKKESQSIKESFGSNHGAQSMSDTQDSVSKQVIPQSRVHPSKDVTQNADSSTTQNFQTIVNERPNQVNKKPKELRATLNSISDYSTASIEPYCVVYFYDNEGHLFAVPSTPFVCHQSTVQNSTKSLGGEGHSTSEIGSNTDSAYSSPPSLGPTFADSQLLSQAYTNHNGVGVGSPMFDNTENRIAIPLLTSNSCSTGQDMFDSAIEVGQHVSAYYPEGHQQLLPQNYSTAINVSGNTCFSELPGWSSSVPLWPNETANIASIQTTPNPPGLRQFFLPTGQPVFASFPLQLNLSMPNGNANNLTNQHMSNDGVLSIEPQRNLIQFNTPRVHTRSTLSVDRQRHFIPTSESMSGNSTQLSPSAVIKHIQKHRASPSDSKTNKPYQVDGESAGLLGNGTATGSGRICKPTLQSQQSNSSSPKVGKHAFNQEQTGRCFEEFTPRFGSSNRIHAAKQKKHTSKTNLYIRGLPSTYTEDQLHTLAPDPDLIRSVKLIAGSEGEMYGFIDFANNPAAKVALVHIKSTNRDLYVNFAYESEKDPHNVYITNIPETWTATNVEDLKNIFQAYGQISTAIVMTKRSNNFCTGAGFVRFIKAEDAQKAIDEVRCNKITLEGGRGPLEVKLADRQKSLEDQSSLTRQRTMHNKPNGDDASYPLSDNGSIVESCSGHYRYHFNHSTRKTGTATCFLPSSSASINEDVHKSVLRAPPASLLPGGLGTGLLPNPQQNMCGSTGHSVGNSHNSFIASPATYPTQSAYMSTDGRATLALALQAAFTSAQLIQPNMLVPQAAANGHNLSSAVPGSLQTELSMQTPGGLLTYQPPAGHLTNGFGVRQPPTGTLFQNPTGIPTAAGLIPLLRNMEDNLGSYPTAGSLNLHRPHQPPFVGPGIHQTNWTAPAFVPGVFTSHQ